MGRGLATTILLGFLLQEPLAKADVILISASRGAGASGSVGSDSEFLFDGSSDFTNAFGPFSFAGGFSLNRPQGIADGYAQQTSDISATQFTMYGTGDANVSSGTGEFDFATGTGACSFLVIFRVVGRTEFDINYSGSGNPSDVEPFFILERIGGPVIVSYYSGTAQELIELGTGTYTISSGIDANAYAYGPNRSGSGLGGLNFTVNITSIPEVSSAVLALLGPTLCLIIARFGSRFR